jgi:hypothetical protein
MCTVNVDTTKLAWATRSCKREQDHKLNARIMHLVEDLEGPISFLSLPAASWAYENQLAGIHLERQFKFYGVEENIEVYNRGVAQADHLTGLYSEESGGSGTEFNMFHHGTTTSFLDNHPVDSFDVVYMDYFGTWSQAKKEDMRRIARGRLGGSVLVVTVGLQRGSALTYAEILEHVRYGDKTIIDFYEINTRSSLKEGSPTWSKVYGVPNCITSIFEQEGAYCKCVGVNVYDSWSQSSPNRFSTEMNIIFDLRDTCTK